MFAKYDFVRKEPKEKKYGGIIPKYYLLGHKKIFEDTLNYFAKVIFPRLLIDIYVKYW